MTKRTTNTIYTVLKKKIIVVRDGGRDRRRPVGRLRAPKDPAVAANSSGKRHDDHKKMKKQV